VEIGAEWVGRKKIAKAYLIWGKFIGKLPNIDGFMGYSQTINVKFGKGKSWIVSTEKRSAAHPANIALHWRLCFLISNFSFFSVFVVIKPNM